MNAIPNALTGEQGTTQVENSSSCNETRTSATIGGLWRIKTKDTAGDARGSTKQRRPSTQSPFSHQSALQVQTLPQWHWSLRRCQTAECITQPILDLDRGARHSVSVFSCQRISYFGAAAFPISCFKGLYNGAPPS
jgi:hypothetical protein